MCENGSRTQQYTSLFTILFHSNNHNVTLCVTAGDRNMSVCGVRLVCEHSVLIYNMEFYG